MSYSISEILSAIAPQFNSDTKKDIHIDLAKRRTSLTAFDTDKYQYAVALRAAHTLTLTKLEQDFPNASGAITQRSEGDQSISFYKGKEEDEYLSLTTYGKDLLGLIKGTILPLDLVNRYNASSLSNINMFY